MLEFGTERISTRKFSRLQQLTLLTMPITNERKETIRVAKKLNKVSFNENTVRVQRSNVTFSVHCSPQHAQLEGPRV